MKIIPILVALIISQFILANEQLGRINDSDGYTNVREKPTTNSKVLFKIFENEYFYFENSDNSDWCRVTNMEGETGFMHQSRIVNLREFTIDGKTYQSDESRLKARIKNIGVSQIKLFQVRTINSNCDAFIEITSNEVKSFNYDTIEALGGHAGVAFLEDVVPNHLLIVKHGDYDGRTILVSEKGKVTDMPGGTVSEIINGKYLLSLAECDLGYCGFSIYDIFQEKIVFKYETEFELFQFQDQIIFDLDYNIGKDYHLFDFDDIEFKKISVLENLNFENNRFNKTINYELKEDCLCY